MATSVTTDPDASHNYVEHLQLYAGRTKELLNWVQSQSGPPHNIVFTCCAKIGEEIFPEAHGKTKKEAKKNAAKIAVEKLKLWKPMNDVSLDSTSPIPSPVSSGNYISKLNEYGQKNDIIPQYIYKTLDTGIPHKPKFSCRVVTDKEYPIAIAGNKQEAKHEAARLAYEEIHKILSPSENMAKPLPGPQKEEESKSISEDSPGQDPKRLTEDQTGENGERTPTLSMDGSPTDSESGMLNIVARNVVGDLNEYCQKRKLSLKTVEVDKIGPSHVPEFIIQFEINDKLFPSASGRTKQEAKQKAAHLALDILKNQLVSISQDGHLLKFNCDYSDGSGSIVFRSSTADSSTPKGETTGGSRSKRRLAPIFTTPGWSSDCTSSQTDGNSEQCQSLQVRIEGFSDISTIGQGGFGRVYKAKYDLDHKYYAVKEVAVQNESTPNTEKSCRNRKTMREVVSLAEMDDLNIVRYYHSFIGPRTQAGCQGRKSLFIKMALYEKNLKEWIEDPDNNKPAQEEVALSIFCQIIDGVVYIHQKKMIHRDLKPENIFLTERNIVKIGDFGLVTTLDDERPLTRGIGTIRYMSPEQRKSEEYSHKVDIFALGLIFFELLWIRLGTASEKAMKWEDIRNSRFPSPFEETYLTQSFLIRKMLCEDASARPEADTIKRRLELGCEQESKTI
ncbi:interferon-induced, double-stranded RNA-activated protein kinase [Heptranchias perlo]|uniref:interferon-induced, double-stranded RNA-activated protein kinase n=1 Tax=Heptranchias perlo TaxID=212740 RepID=UPI003559CE11